MARKLFFILLLGTISFAPISMLAAHESELYINSILVADECEAPPPDSFHVTSIGSNGVDLSWVPALAGATHTLVLFIENGSGGWTNLATYSLIPGNVYTITGLFPGSYKTTIATDCANGETSSRTSEVEFKIIELTTVGRIPINPIPINGCDSLDLNVHWAGFKVTKIGTGISNLFEITLDGKVKRVYYQNRIVAVNQQGFWPIDPLSPLITSSPFRVDDLVDGNPDNVVKIGFLEFKYIGGTFVKLCQSAAFQPWKSEYSFTALIAHKSISNSQNMGSGAGPIFENEIASNAFKIESPFNNDLHIFAPVSFTNGQNYSIRLFNTNGQLLVKHTCDSQSNKVSFNLGWLLPGLYILQIETAEGNQLFRVVKSE
ncbi:MAG: T9SS type A sorting domain-containing protein [Saprospiraceae bacterium]